MEDQAIDIEGLLYRQGESVGGTATQPMQEEQAAPPVQNAAGGPARGTNAEQIKRRFQRLIDEVPEAVEDIYENVKRLGMSPTMIEELGYLSLMALQMPARWTSIRRRMIAAYPEEEGNIPVSFNKASQLLSGLALAAMLQDGGMI